MLWTQKLGTGSYNEPHPIYLKFTEEIILPSAPRSPKWYLPYTLLQNSLYLRLYVPTHRVLLRVITLTMLNEKKFISFLYLFISALFPSFLSFSILLHFFVLFPLFLLKSSPVSRRCKSWLESNKRSELFSANWTGLGKHTAWSTQVGIPTEF